MSVRNVSIYKDATHSFRSTCTLVDFEFAALCAKPAARVSLRTLIKIFPFPVCVPTTAGTRAVTQ